MALFIRFVEMSRVTVRVKSLVKRHQVDNSIMHCTERSVGLSSLLSGMTHIVFRARNCYKEGD